jgi:large repetitive protein
MSSKIMAFVFAGLMILSSLTANAGTIVWTLTGLTPNEPPNPITFTDGGTATGYFTTDSVTGALLTWNITTSATADAAANPTTSFLSSTTYTNANGGSGSCGLGALLVGCEFNVPGGQQYLLFNIYVGPGPGQSQPLPLSGGIGVLFPYTGLVGESTSYEYCNECAANPGYATSRYVEGGSLVGVAAPTLACPVDTAQAGSPYSSALNATGGVSPYAFSNTGSLPAGLILNGSTGAITGTPSAAGVFNFTAQVADSSGVAPGTVTAHCTITVSSQLIVTPGSVSFGSVERFSVLEQTVTLTNAGTGTGLSLGRISLSSYSEDFIPFSLCRSTLAAGDSCKIIVGLLAFHLGSLSTTLNIPNDATGSPQTVPLSVTVNPRY